MWAVPLVPPVLPTLPPQGFSSSMSGLKPGAAVRTTGRQGLHLPAGPLHLPQPSPLGPLPCLAQRPSTRAVPPQSRLLEPQGPGRDSGQALMFSSGERLERLLSLNEAATSKMTAGTRPQEQPWASMPFTLGLVPLPHCCVTLSQSLDFPSCGIKG